MKITSPRQLKDWINESVGSVFLTHFFDSFLKYEIRVQELLKFEVSIPTGRKVSGITGFCPNYLLFVLIEI